MNYESPKLVRYGQVAELTQGGTQKNADAPFGTTPNTAYPPVFPPPPAS